MRKQVLQKHQLAAFSKSLLAIETDLQQKIRFIENYADVYRFPLTIVKRNLRSWRRQLKAVDELKKFRE